MIDGFIDVCLMLVSLAVVLSSTFIRAIHLLYCTIRGYGKGEKGHEAAKNTNTKIPKTRCQKFEKNKPLHFNASATALHSPSALLSGIKATICLSVMSVQASSIQSHPRETAMACLRPSSMAT